MLQMILGPAGTGKTTLLLDALDARAATGAHSILLVPEQFSSSAEGMAYTRLGEEKSAFVQVLSFRTMAERILKNSGGLSLPVLTDAGRVVYVRRALDAVAQGLRRFSRQRRSTAFCNLCAHTMAELKTAGATPDALRMIAQQAGDAKLEEIALIFDAYETAIAGAAADPEDRLCLAAQRAGDGWLLGRHCFVDSFDGFTAPEYGMLRQLLAFCEGVTVALCCDGLSESAAGPDRFSPVRRAAHHLQRLAAQAGVPVAGPRVLRQALRPQTGGLRDLHAFLNIRALPDMPGKGDILLTRAPDEWEEVRQAAAQMYRLALEGVPYSRMALVCRDVAAYESVVRRQCGLFDIPLFVDATGSIEYSAPVAFIRAALLFLREGLGSRGVLALLKSGLCGCDEQSVAALENYVFTWQPGAAAWRAPFENNPEGLLAAASAEAEAQRVMAEALRAELVPIIDEFIQKARGKNAEQLSKRLYILLDRFGAPQHVEAGAQRLGAFGEDARRAWDLTMDLLDEMVALVGSEKLGAEEYDELFLLLVRSTDFGRAPQTLECAVLTSADRMRLSQPDYCFVLGLCEGEFPMQVGYSGLLTHLDRELLVQGGIEMPGSFENRVLLEDMFFYKALTAPKKGLYLSWPQSRSGEAKAQTTALLPLCEALDMRPLCLPGEALCATPAAAYDFLGGVYRQDTPLAASLHAALAATGDEETRRLLALLPGVDNRADWALSDTAVLRRLAGDEMRLSATTIERYYSCQFSYYMERMLRAKPRRKAEVSPLESGTFVHHILEQVLAQAGAGLADWTDEALGQAAQSCADDFVRQYLPQNTRRDAWRLGQIKQATEKLLLFLRDAARQSDFVLDAVELEIGGKDGVPALEIGLANGRRVSVRGKVDRVDALRRDGATWLCVIDYKTGDKKFSLDDVAYGQNMQMLVYLDALCKNGGKRYENPKPAGVLYLCADNRPQSGGRTGEEVAAFRLDGLLVEDADMLRAMEKSGEGVFIPVKYKRDGSLAAASMVADEGRFEAVLCHVEEKVRQMAEGVYGGRFPARPVVKAGRRPCAYCPYRAACRHEDGVDETEMQKSAGAFGGGEETL